MSRIIIVTLTRHRHKPIDLIPDTVQETASDVRFLSVAAHVQDAAN
jgi:hypothetical protein